MPNLADFLQMFRTKYSNWINAISDSVKRFLHSLTLTMRFADGTIASIGALVLPYAELLTFINLH
jgi:hypothetical protein